MKSIDAVSSRLRVLIEPGLPPLLQEPGLGQGWDTALRLPALHALTQGLPGRMQRDHILSGLLEPGEVVMHIETSGQWPSGMQILNVSWLEHEDEPLASAILEAIHGHYPELCKAYDFIDEDDRPRTLPRVAHSRELLPVIRLESVTIHPIAHASTPYLGFDFSCTWDEEHGLGVLTCGTEILEIGTADVSVDTHRAQQHRDEVLARLAGR